MVNAKTKLTVMQRIRARGECGKITTIKQMRNIARSEGITDERVIRTFYHTTAMANKLARL